MARENYYKQMFIPLAILFERTLCGTMRYKCILLLIRKILKIPEYSSYTIFKWFFINTKYMNTFKKYFSRTRTCKLLRFLRALWPKLMDLKTIVKAFPNGNGRLLKIFFNSFLATNHGFWNNFLSFLGLKSLIFSNIILS